MSTSSTDNSKTIGIVAYLTLIGWIIALVMNNNEKSEFGSFHIRQMLGIMILGLALYILNFMLAIAVGSVILSWTIQILMFVIWLLGFIGAVQGEKKPIPVLGEQFQQWFKGIG
ncbi:hypothetical protein POV27_07895 [Aureisphaera galaxeae]|uniref:DUF4870 domain-containing protein n=1 Tax=Aureisphaera galaxeae TaxID=1538023 RepID=UPI00234FE067|nr:hypothetical protein [Aureisphaera galaxeae]MDC8003971.1 hypothetical protein [Aureisphaera galaxeae]